MERRPPPVHFRLRAWLPITAGEIEMRRIAAIPVTRYRNRGNKLPSPLAPDGSTLTAVTVESPLR